MSAKRFDPSRLNRYSIHQRKHLVSREDFGKVSFDSLSLAAFLDSLPNIYAAKDLKIVAKAVAEARAQGRMVHAAMGAHVIKVGLAPVMNDMMARGILTGLSFNGAAVVHDLELAMIGQTSEDVAVSLSDGSFGFSKETAVNYHKAAALAVRNDIGLGEAVGRLINEEKLPYAPDSIFATAQRLGVPVTVHSAFGTDIVHMHPEMDPAALGIATHNDFLQLAALLEGLEGGVWFNIGSAVILPEVFLKALSMARNTGAARGRFTTVNLDMQRHYRPSENVLRRPGGQAIHISGHHEIMLPLLRAAIICEQENGNDSR
jgi:deoxyhypusine synthase